MGERGVEVNRIKQCYERAPTPTMNINFMYCKHAPIKIGNIPINNSILIVTLKYENLGAKQHFFSLSFVSLVPSTPRGVSVGVHSCALASVLDPGLRGSRSCASCHCPLHSDCRVLDRRSCPVKLSSLIWPLGFFIVNCLWSSSL